ncbi:MAG: dTDP-4-dehydrorhamnose reductase [Bacteroidales bacterium]
MNILITGASGQLGNEIRLETQENNRKNKYFFTGRSDIDITNKREIEEFVKTNNIEIIVNCAAYTNVDMAEDDTESAYLLNDTAVKYLADITKKHNIFLIHISTDYVFNGKNYIPYKEQDTPNPEGIYGKSKLAGEKHILHSQTGMIIRTSWLYSSFGKNFVKTISKLANERSELKVVYDQVGSPTYARDLAKCILKIIDEDFQNHAGEIYHFANEGVCSWYDLAKEISNQLELDCKIYPVESKDFPTKAKRPPYSVFNKEKIKTHFNFEIQYWKDSLKEMLASLR